MPEIKTKVFASGIIEHHTVEDYTKRLLIDVMDTKEKATREGLISLGWTPPVDTTEYCHAIRDAESWVNGEYFEPGQADDIIKALLFEVRRLRGRLKK